MSLVRYVFLLVSFLLLSQIVFANGIRVLYFFNPPYELAEELKGGIAEVKNRWKDKVDWIEYDWSNEEHKHWFEKYGVVSLPVAVVECFDRSVKVGRSADFSDKLNEEILMCYIMGREPTEEFPTQRLILTTGFLLGLASILGLILLIRKVGKEKRR